MNTGDRRGRFRALLAGSSSVVPASVYDAISARIAEDLGFECGVMMGSYSAMSVLGSPDINLLTMTELAEQCYRICRAGDLALIVDSDNGFGNALNAMRCAAELERAGVAAFTIEDTAISSPHGAGDKGSLTSVEEAAARMRAAVMARSDKSLVIVGRSNAIALGCIEDTVERVKAYSTTGVDAIFIAPRTRAHVEAVAAATSLPLMLGSVPPDLADAAFLAKNRVRVYMQGHLTLSAAINAVHETMKAVRAGVPAAQILNIASADLVKRVTRADRYEMWAKDFL